MAESNKVLIDLIMQMHEKIDRIHDKLDTKIEEVEDKLTDIENAQSQAKGYFTAISMVICLVATIGFEIIKNKVFR